MCVLAWCAGIVSFVTAALVTQLIPLALALPNPSQIGEEVQKRKLAQAEIRKKQMEQEAERAKQLFYANMYHSLLLL